VEEDRFESTSDSESSPEIKHKRNKHAPTELSSKKPVSRFRQVIEDVPKIIRRDPRFEALSGKFSATEFRKNYSFLNDYRAKELQDIKAKWTKEKDENTKTLLLKQWKSLESKLETDRKKDYERQVIREHIQQEKEKIKSGKKPYFLKRSDKRNLVLTKQFSEMKKSDIDRAIERRRKRNVAKERKKLPMRKSD
ncbi:uncharacterized protein V1516DRAFT_616104, partial [Lipomyces oligophaga]|uniref:uncharacterized protein n=1 Tax=Lipomyces oligophaga TaxID=45792 RepID=UPI0034CD9C9D